MISTDDLEQRWDLSRLYEGPDDDAIHADLEAARHKAEALRGRFMGRVGELEAEDVRTLIDGIDELSGMLNKLFGYAYLLFSSDTQGELAKSLYARIQTEVPEIQNITAFFTIELQHMPEPAFKRLTQAPVLEEYWDHLGRIRRAASHALDVFSEKVITMMESTGMKAWTQLYFETTGEFRVELPGAEEPLTLSQAYAQRESTDRAVRKAALDETLKAHAKAGRVLTSVFNALFQNHRSMMELRKYDHPFAPLLVEENLDPLVIETLMNTVESSYHLYQRFFRAKARVLGIDDFGSHDVRAKFPASSGFIAFEEGRDIVVDSLASFSPRLGEVARRFYDERYIDALSRPGKRAGGYCLSSGPVFHPYIFLNYNYTLKDVIVMAHEMGHGVHNVLGGERHTLTNTDRVTMFMETPSVFAETLTFNRLLSLEVNAATRQVLLGSQIEAAMLKAFKSIALTRFQLNVYERRKQGVLSSQDYCALWSEQLEAMFGESIAKGEWDEWEWAAFEHTLNLPFYDYAYSFGQLLVYALFRRYQEEGPAFEPKYLELLQSGTSITIQPLLAKVGVDLNDPAFWQQGLDYIEQMIEEFEATLEP